MKLQIVEMLVYVDTGIKHKAALVQMTHVQDPSRNSPFPPGQSAPRTIYSPRSDQSGPGPSLGTARCDARHPGVK